MTASPPRGTLRRIAVCLSLALLGALGYGLLEPMLVWNFGWQPLPDTVPAAARHAADDWRDSAEAASARLGAARDALQAPALSAAISVGGKRVWAEAIGYADVESAAPATLDSSFRLGSTSKAVTSVAIGTLLDAGRLDLEQPVSHYVGDLPAPLAGITTRQAMSHTAGVRNYGLCLCFPMWEHLNRRHFGGVRDALRVFERDPLLFQPGTGFAYTSYGYNVAGAVLESIAGKPFLDYVDEAVFKPLHMTHSHGDVGNVGGRVTFYDVADGRYKPAYRIDNSVRLPSGGLLSTPSDMLALGAAIAGDGLLSAATRNRLLTAQQLADGKDNPQGYALGLRVAADKKLLDGAVVTRIVSHHGVGVGSTSYFAVLPEFDVVISVMMNKGQENLDALVPHATALAEIFVADIRARAAPVPAAR